MKNQTRILSRAEKRSAEMRLACDARDYKQYEIMQEAGRRPPYSRLEKKIIRGARRLADSLPRGTQLLYDPYINVRFEIENLYAIK